MVENRRRGTTPDKDALAALASPSRLQKAQPGDVVSALAGPQQHKEAPAEQSEQPAVSAPQAVPKTGTAKKTSFYQLEDDANRMRAAYMNTQLRTGYSSLSEFINAAIDEKVASLESEYNDGQPWEPLTAGAIPQGKPLQR